MLIFALPMSTTQVVISGLTGVSFIFFPTETGYPMWFFYETAMWVACPIGGMILAWLLHSLVEKHIFQHPEARRRLTILLPWQMFGSTYLMFTVALTKNLRFEDH